MTAESCQRRSIGAALALACAAAAAIGSALFACGDGRAPAKTSIPPREAAEMDSPMDAPEGAAAPRRGRHRDEEGQMGAGSRQDARRTRSDFGIEGPASEPAAAAPHMEREAAREAAAKAGIVGMLKAQVKQQKVERYSPYGDDDDGWLLNPDGHKRKRGERAPSEPAPREPAALNASKDGEPTRNAQPRTLDDLLDASLAPSRPAPKAPPRSVTMPKAANPLAILEQLPAVTAADQLLARYATLENLRFIEASGYFENTYVPGDPALRALQARLRGYDRKLLLPDAVRDARLDDGSQRNAQPFDPPAHAALGVFVSASERGLTSARRMLVQVGLQATPRYSGRRPAMNIGLVLDAREPLDAAQAATVRALLAAFADARDLGDKLALFAAGPGGGELVRAEDFRHGPLTVALQRVLSERGAPAVSLQDTVQRALQRVRGGDDPSAPLGSSVLIVLAPRAIGGELPALATLAHQSAVEGIPLSAFGVGPQAVPDELARLALAGQGNRRMLGAGGDAAGAVDRELSAVARVVARAVRLRIKLAAGTRLVAVLGSRPLDARDSQRVRDAETSIDQRIGKNLGIARDRGEDEEGVQIVIPSFYAGDSHTVLLDVVADGAGPIADVTVRFKDLVQLGNGVARESLWLPNLDLARGALERNVIKNLIAYEVARELRTAGDALAGHDGGAARQRVGQALALLESVGRAIPELHGDRELEADRSLVAEYVALLADVDRESLRDFAADSLHFASLMKLQPRPEWDAREK